MCDKSNSVKMELPHGMNKLRKNRFIYVDECVECWIRMLWDRKFETVSSCCGHGKHGPILIIANFYKKRDIVEIENILKQDLNRVWEILQIKTVKVGSTLCK
ncbi:MAG: hypothetical protein ACFE95_12310 [Candidatus Hodarchaeota archaeon]